MALFAALTGARTIIFGDATGAFVQRSRLSVLLLGSLRFALEIFLGYAILVPLAWCVPLLRGPLRLIAKLSGKKGKDRQTVKPTLSVLYVKATIVAETGAASAGGMASHIAGFTSGAVSLGHDVHFLSSSATGIPSGAKDLVVLRPSGAFSATRAVFETWNALLFTWRALHTFKLFPKPNFIYQRYNRFNCAGAILSARYNLPLILEYNGSEVWVGKNWDPVGMLPLIARIERFNQRAADVIVVVSEAERHNLLAAGVENTRILVNPNGVNVDTFRPGAGGNEVREQLRIASKTVVGFLGTFGPWHGAEVLAHAACAIDQPSRFHFLFVGDGDLRADTEKVFENAGKRELTTFTGRIPHDRAPAYLDACDILVSPHVPSKDATEFFGSPTKLFEYLSSGKPVIASKLGQIGDIIVDGETGILVTPGDVEELAKAILRVADDPALGARIGANGRDMVASKFTWTRNAARVFEAFDKIHEEYERSSADRCAMRRD